MSSNTTDDIDLESIKKKMQEAANIKDKEVAKDTNIDTTIKPAIITPHTQTFHNHSTDNPCTETDCTICHSSRYLSVVSDEKYEQPTISMKQYPSTPQQLQQLQKEHQLVHNILYTFAEGPAEDLPGGKNKVCPKWTKQQSLVNSDDEPGKSSGDDEEEEGGSSDVNSHPIYGQKYDTSNIPQYAVIFAETKLTEAALHCTGNIELWSLLVDNVVDFAKLISSPQNQKSHDHSWKKVEGRSVEDIIANKEANLTVEIDESSGTIHRIRYRKFKKSINIVRGMLTDPEFMDHANEVARHLNGLGLRKEDVKSSDDLTNALCDVNLHKPPGESVTQEEYNNKVNTFINEVRLYYVHVHMNYYCHMTNTFVLLIAYH